jgi:hypothetical protein
LIRTVVNRFDIASASMVLPCIQSAWMAMMTPLAQQRQARQEAIQNCPFGIGDVMAAPHGATASQIGKPSLQ